MARMRSVKPEFWTDPDLAELSRDARLLYIGLWNLSDEHGRVRGDARYLKGQLFAYDDDLTPHAVDSLVAQLDTAGKAVRYEAEGRAYLFLPTLARHQRLEPDKVPSRLPPPPCADQSEPSEDTRADSSGPRADESERGADELSLSRQHVAGGMKQAAGQRGANGFAPTAAAPDKLDQAAAMVADALAVDHATAIATVAAIQRERTPRSLTGLVRTLIDADEIGSWLPRPGGARASPCHHGKANCPECRSEQIGAA